MPPNETNRMQRARLIVGGYPIVIALIGAALNLYLFGVNPLVLAMPSQECFTALATAAILLAVNHSWLMTTTELTRVQFGMFATPEEWLASGKRRGDVVPQGEIELERQHNAHRNTTENAVYFVLLSLLFALTSPPSLAVNVWIVGFALARLGYTHAYLSGKDGLRGLFMTASLLALYGLASYLGLSVLG